MIPHQAGKKNMEKQQEFADLLGEECPFSPKGLKYLANRALDTKYNTLLDAALNAMLQKKLQRIVPETLKKKIRKAFNFTKDIPDAALVIIATGRRPVHGAKGFDEGGVSLLTDPIIPDNLDTLDAKTQETIVTRLELRTLQKEVSEELMALLQKELNKPEPPAPKPETPQPTADVMPFKKAATKRIRKPKKETTNDTQA